MNCPRCGYEVSSEEAFCGQCGTPIAPQARPPDMVNMPPTGSGRLHSYPPDGPFGQQNFYGVQPPAHVNSPGVSLPPSAASIPQHIQPQVSNPRTDFYQDATEAMTVLPGSPQVGYQQPVSAPPSPGAYAPQGTPGQYGFQANQPMPLQGQLLQAGNYANRGYPQQPVQGGQSYRRVPTPPQKQKNGAVIFIVSICLVVALLSAVGVLTLYISKVHNTVSQDPQTQGPALTATIAPTVTATTAPTPTDTIAPTVTATTAPTPTVSPTSMLDSGFLSCGQPCTINGFSTEYPHGWLVTPLTTIQGVQFANPALVDQSATFKTPDATGGTPSELVANDLQQNFANKNNYSVVTPESTAYIGGETWFKEVITYQGSTRQEHVEVYANVHQGKAYILELQASEDQFPAINAQYFENITGRFLFQ